MGLTQITKRLTNFFSAVGSLLYSTSGDAAAELPIGFNGQVLTVSSLLPSWQDSGFPLAASDTSISITGSMGNLIKVAPALNGGLATSNGLYVYGFRTVSTAPGSLTVGESWFNTTVDLPMVYTAGLGISILPVVSVITSNGPLLSFTANTTPQVIFTETFPAGYFNYLVAHLRLWVSWYAASTVANTFTFSLLINGTVAASATTGYLATPLAFGANITYDIETVVTGGSGAFIATSEGVVSQIGSAAQAAAATPVCTQFNVSSINLTGTVTISLTVTAATTTTSDTVGIYTAFQELLG